MDINAIKWGDIYLINFGESFGCEQGGIRPALVVQNDKGNMFSPTILVCPITSQTKRDLPTHINIGTECGLEKPSTVLFEQVRCADKKRVVKKIGHINEDMINSIQQCLTISFNIMYNVN